MLYDYIAAMVRENLNPTVDIVGILPTMYDGRTVHCREAVQMLEESFGDYGKHKPLLRK